MIKFYYKSQFQIWIRLDYHKRLRQQIHKSSVRDQTLRLLDKSIGAKIQISNQVLNFLSPNFIAYHSGLPWHYTENIRETYINIRHACEAVDVARWTRIRTKWVESIFRAQIGDNRIWYCRHSCGNKKLHHKLISYSAL